MWVFRRAILGVFLLNIFTFVEAAEVSASSRPDLFKSQTSGFLGTCRRNLRLIKLYAAGHEILIERVTGQRFVASETFLLPAPNEEGEISEDKDVKAIQAWIDRYKSYPEHMGKLERALGRYLGEDPTQDQAFGDVRDPKTDAARLKGRIKIFEQTLVDAMPSRTWLFQFWRPKASERSTAELLELPTTVELPRSPARSGDQIGDLGFSSFLSKRDLRDRSEIRSFIRNDNRESFEILTALAKREIEQAEIYVRLRVFLDAFPEDANQKLRTRLALIEKAAESEANAEQKVGKERESALVNLYDQISKLMSKREDLKPTERSLEVITNLIQLSDDRTIGLAQTRNWVERAKTYTRWVWAWEAAISKPVKKFQSPMITWLLLVAVVGDITDFNRFVYDKGIRPVFNRFFSNPEEVQNREEYESLLKLKAEISDVSVNYPDFYERYRKYAQATFSDEAVNIAFKHIDQDQAVQILEGKKVRTELKVNKAWTPGWGEQAVKIIRFHNYLLDGVETHFGRIAGVDARLWIRDENVRLTKKISEKKSQAGPPIPDTNSISIAP